MKLWSLLLFSYVFAACAPLRIADPKMPTPYPDLGPAPSLAGDTWLNTTQPLRPDDLYGKVVLLDMWTFG
jgi:hypothetical protein